MLLSIIATLGFNIILSSTPAKDCGHPNTIISGCYFIGTKDIILGVKDEFLESHEVGHATGLDVDRDVRRVIDKHIAIRKIDPSLYPTPELREREKIADWFAFYLTNEMGARKLGVFQEDYPDIDKIFDIKIKELLNK